MLFSFQRSMQSPRSLTEWKPLYYLYTGQPVKIFQEFICPLSSGRKDPPNYYDRSALSIRKCAGLEKDCRRSERPQAEPLISRSAVVAGEDAPAGRPAETFRRQALV